MKPMFSVTTLLLLGLAVPQLLEGQMVDPSDYVKQAVKAAGGADALQHLRRLTIDGEATHWEPG
jgi:hypothetical protein